MVHHELDALLMSILVECVDIEVRIWSHEVEDIVLVAVCPVFPSFVPSLHENLVKAVLCSEVDIAANLLVVCRVTAVRGCACIVCLAELNSCKIVSVCP